jgi:polyhydroxybutyrate depolymerase
LLAGAVLALALASPAQSAEVLKLPHQGTERTVILQRTRDVRATAPPLLIVLHGSGTNAETFRIRNRFDATADREKFVVAYPDAIGKQWRFGQVLEQAAPENEAIDDVGFIRALIDDLVSRKIVDPARVYVTGVSRGGLMSYTLACSLHDKITAVAPLISPMTDRQRDACRKAQPIPIMAIAGTADKVLPFDGQRLPKSRLLSMPDTMDFWRKAHACSAPQKRTLPHRDANDPTRIEATTWSECKTGARVVLYRVEGGGHRLPSLAGEESATEKRTGPRNRDIETADEVWEFFRGFSR